MVLKVLKFSQEAEITELKHGDNVFNGKYGEKRVTIVEGDYVGADEKKLSEDHVLGYITCTSDGYTIREPYACTLEEFLKVKKQGYSINLIRCTEEEREVLKKTDLLTKDWKVNGCRHTPDAVNILRDLIEAEAELRSKGLVHGDLNPSNIVLCVIGGKIRAKVTRLKPGCRDIYADYQSLPKLILDLFGSPPANKALSSEAFDLWFHIMEWPVPGNKLDEKKWSKCQEASRKTFVLDPRSLFSLPIFWSDEVHLFFVFKMRWVFERCHQTGYFKRPQVASFLKDIEALNQSDWFSKLKKDTDVHDRLYDKKSVVYDKDLTEDLLRFMRNLFSHFEAKTTAFKVAIGDIPHGFFEYFRSRYPALFVETRRVFRLHFANLKAYADLTHSYQDYL